MNNKVDFYFINKPADNSRRVKAAYNVKNTSHIFESHKD